MRIGVVVVPNLHGDIFNFDGRGAFGMCLLAPYHSLLAEFFHILNVSIRKVPELLNHLLVLVGIFISTNVHVLSTENRFVTTKILFEQRIQESVCFGVEQIQVVFPVFLTG